VLKSAATPLMAAPGTSASKRAIASFTERSRPLTTTAAPARQPLCHRKTNASGGGGHQCALGLQFNIHHRSFKHERAYGPLDDCRGGSSIDKR
jgi:hypothetical protein